MAEAKPGWYHGKGDPEGTVRYWDGEQWIGEPVMAPQAPRPEPAAQTPVYGSAPSGGYSAGAGAYSAGAASGLGQPFFSRLLSPHGRVNRATYAGVLAIGFALAFVLAFVDLAAGTFSQELGLGLFSGLSGVVWLWPQLATSSKRFHDQGFSGWLAVLLFLPFAGLLVILWLVAFPGKPDPNNYGQLPPPGFNL